MNELTTNVTAVSNLKEMKVIIRSELESLVDGFVSLGYYLKKTRDTEMFAEEGYENIYDFAKAEYNLSKSNVSRYMAINDKFSIEGNSPELAEKFREFGSSKLSEMLTLTDDQLDLITTDATREDIREYKKIINENDTVAPAQQGINTEAERDFEPTKNGLNEFVDNYFKNEGRTNFEKVISIILSTNEDREEKIMYTIAPSKFKMIRIHGGTVLLNADNITIMKITQGKEIYSYSDLIKTIEYIYKPDGGTAKEIYRQYYNEDLERIEVKVEIKDVKEEPKKPNKELYKESKESKKSKESKESIEEVSSKLQEKKSEGEESDSEKFEEEAPVQINTNETAESDPEVKEEITEEIIENTKEETVEEVIEDETEKTVAYVEEKSEKTIEATEKSAAVAYNYNYHVYLQQTNYVEGIKALEQYIKGNIMSNTKIQVDIKLIK